MKGIEPFTPPSWVVASFLADGDCGNRTRACHRHGIPYIYTPASPRHPESPSRCLPVSIIIVHSILASGSSRRCERLKASFPNAKPAKRRSVSGHGLLVSRQPIPPRAGYFSLSNKSKTNPLSSCGGWRIRTAAHPRLFGDHRRVVVLP